MRLLENGWTGSFRTPGAAAPAHQQWFLDDRDRACKAMGCKFISESFGVMKIHFPGAALEAFEEMKRATKSKTSGKGAVKVVTPMPYANWALPTNGAALSWQEFFGFVGHVYKLQPVGRCGDGASDEEHGGEDRRDWRAACDGAGPEVGGQDRARVEEP